MTPWTARRPGRNVVIGLGEPWRRDDGCGPAVVRALDGHLPREVERVERVASPVDLLDVWDGARLAIVVDAVRSGGAPGSVVRIDGGRLADGGPTSLSSSHGFSVREAFALGGALDRLPERLVVYGIEVEQLGRGEHLSPAVAAGVSEAATAILRELAGALAGLPEAG